MGTSMSISKQEKSRLYYANHSIPRKNIRVNKRKKFEKLNGIYYIKQKPFFNEKYQEQKQKPKRHSRQDYQDENIIQKSHQFDTIIEDQMRKQKGSYKATYPQDIPFGILSRNNTKQQLNNWSKQKDILSFLFPTEVQKRQLELRKGDKIQLQSKKQKILNNQTNQDLKNQQINRKNSLNCGLFTSQENKKRNYQTKLTEVLQKNRNCRTKRAQSLQVSRRFSNIGSLRKKSVLNEKIEKQEDKLESKDQNNENCNQKNEKNSQEPLKPLNIQLQTLRNKYFNSQYQTTNFENSKSNVNSQYYCNHIVTSIKQQSLNNASSLSKCEYAFEQTSKKDRFLQSTTNEYFSHYYQQNQMKNTGQYTYIPPKNLIYF